MLQVLTATNVALVAVLGVVAWLVARFVDYLTAYRAATAAGAHIPGPPPKFPLGTTYVWSEFEHLEMWRLAMDKYGDPKNGIMGMQLGTQRAAVILHHEHLKQVTNATPHHMSPSHSGPGDFSRWWVGTESLLYIGAKRHQDWVRIRRLLARSFMSVNLRPMIPPLVAVHHRFREVLHKEIKRQNPAGNSATLDFAQCILALNFDILGKAAFSTDFKAIAMMASGSEEKHPVLEAFSWLLHEYVNRDLQSVALRPWRAANRIAWVPTPSNRTAVRYRATVRKHINAIIAERQAILQKDPNAKFTDFMQEMMRAQDEESGTKLTLPELRDNLITILFAGHDTTATNLMFAIYEIAKNPEVQKKLQEEVDALVPESGEVTIETYASLDYVRLVLKEALRLYSPIPFSARTPQKDLQLGPYTVKKDCTIFLPLYHIMRDPHNFVRPLDFLPERHSASFADRAPFHAFTPFLHGQRTCLGMRFAEVTAALTLSIFVRKFEFRLPEGFKLNVKFGNVIQLADLPLIVTERE